MESVTAHSSSETLSVAVPLGHVSFAWSKGSSTVSDVSFVIKDAENHVVYSYSGALEGIDDGVFLQTNNSCGNGTDCDAPTDLWAFAEGEHVVLAWTSYDEYADYNVYRDGQLLQTVRDNPATFVDETATHGGHCYFVAAFCASGESDPTNEACATIGDDCQPATNLWYEMTSNNKIKLTWVAPQPHDGLSGYFVYRTKEVDMNWQKIKTLGANSTSYTDNSLLEDETFYLYKVVAYYQDIDCYSAPARSKYNELEFFLRVYWSVDGMAETEAGRVEVYPNPASETLRIDGLEAAEIQVYNPLGQRVKEVHGTNEVNVSGLPEGLYLLRITDTYGEEHSVRIVVKE